MEIMKKLLLLLLVCLLSVSLYSQIIPHEDMTDYANATFVSGGAKITGSQLNLSITDIINSRQSLHYDITKPYVEDSSVVIHNQILYRCIDDNAAGAFDPLDWDPIPGDSIAVERISASTDTTRFDSLTEFHDPVGMNTQATTEIPLSLAGDGDLILKITGTSDTALYVSCTNTGANIIGYYAVASGGTNSTVAVEGMAGDTVKTIPSLSYVGVLGQAGSATLNNFGVVGNSVFSGIGTNIGGRFGAINGGLGSAYTLQLEIIGTKMTGKVPIAVDSIGNIEMSDTVETNTGFKFDRTWSIIKDTSITVASGAMLTSFATPVVILPAPGANRILEIIHMTAFVNFNTTAYATNTNVFSRYTGETPNICRFVGLISTVADTILIGAGADVSSSLNVEVNTSVEIYTDTGNPTAGDSPVTFFVTYIERKIE